MVVRHGILFWFRCCMSYGILSNMLWICLQGNILGFEVIFVELYRAIFIEVWLMAVWWTLWSKELMVTRGPIGRNISMLTEYVNLHCISRFVLATCILGLYIVGVFFLGGGGTLVTDLFFVILYFWAHLAPVSYIYCIYSCSCKIF